MAERVSLDAARLSGLIDTVPFAERLWLIPDIFARLDTTIGQAGFFHVGPQTALYRMDGDRIEVRVGVPLDQPRPGFEMFEAAAAQAMFTRLRGGFDGLPQVYQDLNRTIQEQGLQRGTWSREVYRQVARDARLNVTDIYMDIAT